MSQYLNSPSQDFEATGHAKVASLEKSIEDMGDWHYHYFLQLQSKVETVSNHVTTRGMAVDQAVQELTRQNETSSQHMREMTEEAERVVADQKSENVDMRATLTKVEERNAGYRERLGKLEQELQDNIAGEAEVEKRITQVVETLKVNLQAYLQQEMPELRGRNDSIRTIDTDSTDAALNKIGSAKESDGKHSTKLDENTGG